MNTSGICILLMVFILFQGCAEDLQEFRKTGDNGALRLDYLVDGQLKDTRSVQAVSDEVRLQSALIFFFDLDSRNALAFAYVEPSPDSRTISFDPPEELHADTDYYTLILGNPDYYLNGKTPEMFAEEIMCLNYEAARVEISYFRKDAISRGNPGVLPMFGQFVDAVSKTPKTFKYHQYDDIITANGLFFFSRAVSRIDLENFVPSTLLVEEVKLINYQAKGYPLTEGLRGNDIVDFIHSGSEGWVNVPAIEAGEDAQKLTSAIYCFPNIVTLSQPNDNQTTALLIKGRYCESRNGEDYDDYSTYYRFNLTNTGKGQVLSRNYAYRASIKGVKHRGASTPGEAVMETIPVFDYEIADDWQATDENAVSDGHGNYLIVSKSHFTFDGEDDLGSSLSLNIIASSGIEWSVAPDEEGNGEDSFNNDLFLVEKIDDSTLKIAPLQTNHSDYVRFGRFVISARSTHDESVELKLVLNIQQLTTSFNFATLTVDGCIGSMIKRLDPQGGTLKLKVLTGASSNTWFAIDQNSAIQNWGANSHFTEMGNNGSELEIEYDANISGEARETVLKVFLNPAINSEDAVKPVFITLTQDMTTELFTLSPSPVDSFYDVDCCSYENIPTLTVFGGNHQAKNFTVSVIPAAGVEVEVSTNASDRDITVDPTGWKSPCLLPSMLMPETNLANYRVIETITNPRPYYISAESMAPADGAQTCYKMHLKAKDPVSGYVQERIVTFRMHAIEGEVNDCIIRIGEDFFLIPDRNIGTPGRVSLTGDSQEAQYFMTSGDGRGVIPGFQANRPFNTYSEFGGTYGTMDNLRSQVVPWIRDVNNDPDKRFSPFYLPGEADAWDLMSDEVAQALAGRVIFSKCRAFILSDYPKINHLGKPVPVFRWLNMANKNYMAFSAYLGLDGGFEIFAHGYTNGFFPTITSGVAFPVRKLNKQQVSDYLINYLGYSEATLPMDLK